MRTFFLTCLLVVGVSLEAAVPSVEYKRIEDVIYGRKSGTALTMDVLKPEKANGKGIVLLLSAG